MPCGLLHIWIEWQQGPFREALQQGGHLDKQDVNENTDI